MRIPSIVAACAALLLACAPAGSGEKAASPKPTSREGRVAVFAGGCFWCMEAAFDRIDGVIDAESGYTGGDEPDPTYGEVSSGTTGHVEAIRVHYDPARITYAQLLEVFWRQIQPTDDKGQFADRGSQYRAGIFVADDEQRRLAEESKKAIAASGRFDGPIVTPIRDAGPFYPAEEYHQNYWRKHPDEYERYRWGSGRGPFLKRIWGDDHP